MKNPNLKKFFDQPYKYGFSTNIDKEIFPSGVDEKIIKLISEKKKNQNLCLNSV